jgi:hypothetical protein
MRPCEATLYHPSVGVTVSGRVEWSRREPGEVETVLSIMLRRENPLAERVRPSRGDRGVDVYIPGSKGWTVYQIKSFTGSLTDSRKRQIRKSWDSFRHFVKTAGLTIDRYVVIRPEDATWQDREFLDEVTAGADFPCSWQGLVHCERLAADHPSVVDYYLFHGKDRLTETIRQLFSAMGRSGSEPPLDPGHSFDSLDDLYRAINEQDPHYRYEFQVRSGGMPPIEAELHVPGLVAAVTRVTDEQSTTFRVFARYQDAIADRPIPARFTTSVQAGSTAAEALKDFVEYGLPATDIPVKDMYIDLPGNLGGEVAEGTVRMAPAPQAPSDARQFTLEVLDHDGVAVAASDLNLAITRGDQRNRHRICRPREPRCIRS